MSKTGKITLWVVVIIVIVGGAIWYSRAGTGQPGQAGAPTATTTTQQPNAPATVSANGTSDAQLNSDLANTDSQMNSFSSDSASIDQGLNDQPVQQQSL